MQGLLVKTNKKNQTGSKTFLKFDGRMAGKLLGAKKYIYIIKPRASSSSFYEFLIVKNKFWDVIDGGGVGLENNVQSTLGGGLF